MSKLGRVTDFQVSVRRFGFDDKQKPVNLALFTTYESVRLWLKERDIEAPFGKILVSLADEAKSGPWHGKVKNAIGICEVTEALDPTVILENAKDHRWVLGIVEHALACIEREVGWRSAALNDFIKTLADRPLPLVHFFESLARVDKPSGVKCIPWLSTQPGETMVGARIGAADHVLLSNPGPLYLEDSFPVAKSAIRDQKYTLLDKAGNVLASVAVNDADLN